MARDPPKPPGLIIPRPYTRDDDRRVYPRCGRHLTACIVLTQGTVAAADAIAMEESHAHSFRRRPGERRPPPTELSQTES